jgi:predicted DNA-binding mobile mystery protein A
MPAPYRKTARRQLDERLASWRDLDLATPPDGWIRAVRQALGMSIADLARRLDVTAPAVRKYEAAEAAGTIQLSTLRRVAEALGVELQYALAPRSTLVQLVEERALAVARRELDAVNHSMALEQQRPDPSTDAELVARRARELVESSGLWRDE